MVSMTKLKPLLILMLMLCSAACAGRNNEVVVVPTLAQLPTATETFTPSPTQVPTWTDTPTDVPTDIPTVTPSDTPTATPTVTPSLTITPTLTPTFTATFTPTDLPTEPAAINSLVELALNATILPAVYVTSAPALGAPITATPTVGVVNCPNVDPAMFDTVNPRIAGMLSQLGCPVGTTSFPIVAVQPFEHGLMVYIAGSPGTIYALLNSGRALRFTDTWQQGVDPDNGGEQPPVGLLEPQRGFGKVWRSSSEVRNELGWALSPESGNEGRLLDFQQGRAMYLPQRDQTIVILNAGGESIGTWQAFIGGG
jgi:hypothetical protein